MVRVKRECGKKRREVLPIDRGNLEPQKITKFSRENPAERRTDAGVTKLALCRSYAFMQRLYNEALRHDLVALSSMASFNDTYLFFRKMV